MTKVGEVDLKEYITGIAIKHKDDPLLAQLMGECIEVCVNKIGDQMNVVVSDNAVLVKTLRDFIELWKRKVNVAEIPLIMLSEMDRMMKLTEKEHPGDHMLAILDQFAQRYAEDVQSATDKSAMPPPSSWTH